MTESAPVTVNFRNKALRADIIRYGKSKSFHKPAQLLLFALNEYIRRHPSKIALPALQDWIDGVLG